MAVIFVVGQDNREAVAQAMAIDAHEVRFLDTTDHLADVARHTIPELLIIDLLSVPGHPWHIQQHPCRRARSISALARTPILCLAPTVTAQDIALVLDAGGDDCMRVPFVGRELAARVRALLRRLARPGSSAPLVLDGQNKKAQLYGALIDLTPTEYDLLETLCQNSGEHLTAEDLLERVWHYPPGVGDPALVRNHVRNLRRKLERDPNRPRIVVSAHGRGYSVSVSSERRS